MSTPADLPIDPESAAWLSNHGLDFTVEDPADQSAFASWFQAVMRGFLDPQPSDDILETRRLAMADRRRSAVRDSTAADPGTPVATVAGWATELTVPGQVSVPAWAISAVSVAPTHRRRGIAQAMLTAQLRTARDLGLPLAILTVSEATIYGRWGFAPATMTADWTIDVKRARWTGPRATGRVQFVDANTLLSQGHELVERVRLETPGQIEFHGLLWERLLGVGDDARSKKLRFVRYDDADGAPRGFAVYSVSEETGFGGATLTLSYLAAATDDAYAALWQFFVEMDLIATIVATLRPVDEPFRHRLSDFRATHPSNEHDHLWVRIVDVPAALEARRYHAPGHLVFDVTDELDHAAGRFLLTISSDGTAVATVLDGDIPDDADAVALTVNELSAIYVGGVSPVTLAHAGRIEELTPGAAAVVEASFRSATTPWLSIWF